MVLLVHYPFAVAAVGDGPSQVNINANSGGANTETHHLFWASTWESLNKEQRASLYVAAAAAGVLGEELRACAQIIQPAHFQYNNDMAVRGVAAFEDLSPSVLCNIGEGGILSLATVKKLLATSSGRQDPLLANEIEKLDSLVTSAADERSLLAVLFLREAAQASSPLMPYLQALLWRAHEEIPSAWNPNTAEGSARRAALAASSGPTTLKAADALRKHIFQQYSELVPRALDLLPQLLVHGVGGEEEPRRVAAHYSFQRFAEVWLGMRSRSFDNGAYGLLVPLICLMNHPGVGEESNVDAEYDEVLGFVMKAKRPIRQGEELRYSYGAHLCRERALLVYGFVLEGMPPCSGMS